MAREDEAGPKYPNITVKLIGEDGNAFSIMGAVKAAMKKAGVPGGEIDRFMGEAMSGSYGNLLNVCSDWVEVE